MSAFTIQDLSHACRIFMALAYPDGAAAIPEQKRAYFHIAADAPLEHYLPPSLLATPVCRDLSVCKGGVRGYEFRLGSAAYPHLKLRVQLMDLHHHDVWVYSVDTHDRLRATIQHCSAEDAQAWRELMAQNLRLKQQIEEALALAGFLTPTSVLRLDLTAPA